MRHLLLVLIAVALGTLAAQPDTALGISFVVDSTTDAIDANAGDGVCATTGGECTLRGAIMEANALAGPDTIELPAGTYNLSIAGAGEDASETGDLDILSDVTINGASAASTTIDGAAIDRVIDVNGEANPTTATIRNVTIRNGVTTGFDSGGGLQTISATVSLTDVVVTENSVPGEFNRGGGIFAGFGSITLTDSTVSGNTSGAGGGGIAAFPAELTLIRSAVINNTAGGGGGGILRAFAGSNPATISDSTISGNSSTSGSGGGISNEADQMSIANSVISDNTAPIGQGGGIHNTGQMTIDASTVGPDNSANHGGGIAFQGGTILVRNSTISGNVANPGNGGAIWAPPAPGPFSSSGASDIQLENVTIGNNTAKDGGASIDVFRSTSLVNTVLESPTVNCMKVGGIISLGHNLSDDDSCGLTGPADSVNTDPLIGPLADNGGLTATHALLPGSPAIDAGDDSNCPATDQRGAARPQGAGCDIGSFEFGELPTATPVMVESVLTEDASAGTTVLEIPDNAGFSPRDLVVINPGEPTEEHSVVTSLGSLVLAAPLQYSHSIAERVVRLDTGIPVGDADCNHGVDTTDILTVLLGAGGIGEPSHCLSAANVDCNGAVNAVDALLLLRFLADIPLDGGVCLTTSRT